VEVGGHLTPGLPKTGPRTVAIPAPLADEISIYLASHPAGRGDLVFRAPDGGPLLHPNFYRRAWKPALERAKLDPGLRIHDLRHSAVAMAISTGAHAKEIQELCGHSSITTTFNVYGHLLPNLSERLADRLGELFLQAAAPHDVAN
jgi:integrase